MLSNYSDWSEECVVAKAVRFDDPVVWKRLRTTGELEMDEGDQTYSRDRL